MELRAQVLWLSALVALLSSSVTSFNDLTDPPPKFSGHDVTEKMFDGNNSLEVYPVAFADFNADKLTDVIAISRNRSSFHIYFAYEEEPLLREKIMCNMPVKGTRNNTEVTLPVRIVGISPGDFNGDGRMDLLVSFIHPAADGTIEARVFQGYLNYIDCSEMVEVGPLAQEPLVVDLNGDMVMDLIGEFIPDKSNSKLRVKTVWEFQPNEKISYTNYTIKVTEDYPDVEVKGKKKEKYQYKDAKWLTPSSNAYVDTNSDTIPELIAVSRIDHGHCNISYIERYDLKGFEKEDQKWHFSLSHVTVLDDCSHQLHHIGQPVFMDLFQNGELIQILAVCGDLKCQSPGMKAIQHQGDSYRVVDIDLKFQDWSYIRNSDKSFDDYYNEDGVIALRVGDYNMDGFPDLIGTMMKSGLSATETDYRAIIFENVPCNTVTQACSFPRTFQLDDQSLITYRNVTMSAFYDIYEDGLLDVMVVRKINAETKPELEKFGVFGYQSKPDYDANYLKVVVTTGRECKSCPNIGTPYGNVIPGPVVRYNTTTQTGELQTSVAAQNYRSAHRPLDLPYVFFGIGHSPNFIETLDVAVSNGGKAKNHRWTQLIPNSQIIIIPKPPANENEWRAKIFLPSNVAAVHTFGVLLGFCAGIVIIIVIFFWRERREDKKDRLLESGRLIM